MSQDEFHPGAESLNAFAEQALDARERGNVLEHLAACARCRQIVSLAREAAEADAVPAAQPIAIQPNAWWKRWRLLWVPAAVAATFAVASISVFIHQAEQREAATRVAQQTAAPGLGTAPSPTERAETAPQAPPDTGNAPAKSAVESRKLKVASSRTEAAVPASLPAAMPAAPPSAATTETAEVTQDQPKPEPVRPRQESATEALPLPGTPAFRSTTSAPQQEQQREMAQEKKQLGTAIARDRLVAAKVAPSKAENSAGSATRSNGALQGVGNASAEVSSRQLEARSESLGSLGLMKSPRAAGADASPVMAVHLPSGLAAISIASANHRTLAIDAAGVLFASEDRGITWRRVTTQWSGRAILVITQKFPIANAESAPAAQMSSAAEAAANPAAVSETPSPTIFLEIINDKNQIWWSTDGLIWIAK